MRLAILLLVASLPIAAQPNEVFITKPTIADPIKSGSVNAPAEEHLGGAKYSMFTCGLSARTAATLFEIDRLEGKPFNAEHAKKTQACVDEAKTAGATTFRSALKFLSKNAGATTALKTFQAKYLTALGVLLPRVDEGRNTHAARLSRLEYELEEAANMVRVELQ